MASVCECDDMYGVYTQHRPTKTETHHYDIVSRLVSLCVCVQSYHRHCGEKEKRTYHLARYRCFVQGFLVSLRSLRDAKKKNESMLSSINLNRPMFQDIFQANELAGADQASPSG